MSQKVKDQKVLEQMVMSTIMRNEPINAQKIKKILGLTIKQVNHAIYRLHLRQVIEIKELKTTGTLWKITGSNKN